MYIHVHTIIIAVLDKQSANSGQFAQHLVIIISNILLSEVSQKK